jgi:hypothetical protein
MGRPRKTGECSVRKEHTMKTRDEAIRDLAKLLNGEHQVPYGE